MSPEAKPRILTYWAVTGEVVTHGGLHISAPMQEALLRSYADDWHAAFQRGDSEGSIEAAIRGCELREAMIRADQWNRAARVPAPARRQATAFEREGA